MELKYKVPIIRGVRDILARQDMVTPYLEWYLKGLQDAGAIKNYKFEPAKDSKFSIKEHDILTIDLVDESRSKQIDLTLTSSYGAIFY